MLAADCRRLIRPTRLLQISSSVKQANLKRLFMLRQASDFLHTPGYEQNSYPWTAWLVWLEVFLWRATLQRYYPLLYLAEDIGRPSCYRRGIPIRPHAVGRKVTVIVISSSSPKSLVTVASPPDYISDSRSPSRAGSSIISKHLIFTIERREERSTSPSTWPQI